MRNFVYLWVIILLQVPAEVFACSGPAAMETINDNFQRAVVLAILAGAMEVVSGFLYIKTRRKLSLWLLGLSTLFFAVHPAWTVSAMIGDCGQAKVSGAILFTVIVFVLFVVQVTVSLLSRRLVLTSSRRIKQP